MAVPIKFTKKAIEKLPIPSSGRDTYRDFDNALRVGRASITGLQLTVSSSATVSFLLCRKFKGRTKKITIGRFPELSVERARIQALELINEMNRGIDPLKARRAERERGVTVEQAFTDYIESRGNKLATSTVKGYKMILNNHLSDWKLKPIKEVSEDMVVRKHNAISEFSPNSATSSMKVLRAVLNYSRSTYKNINGQSLIPINPVDQLSQQRLWNRQTRRVNKVHDSELRNLFRGIEQLKGDPNRFTRIAASYFELLLFTGLRKTEASVLKVGDVNFAERVFTLRETKNGKCLTIPMSDHTEKLLRGCCVNRQNGYVFEGSRSCGHINDPKKELETLKSISGLQFSCHDLRRTFISIAESLDISEYAIKQLVNHSTGTDVTAGYVIMDMERVRKPMQRITDHILDKSQTDDSHSVVY